MTSVPHPQDFNSLLHCLAAGTPGVVVVTPNRRLARTLELAVAERHVADARQSWPAPDVLAWDQWLVRLHETASFDESGEPLPRLLPRELERLVWEGVIARQSGSATLVGAAVLSREAQQAARLAHEWGMQPTAGSEPFATEDTQAFARWLQEVEAEAATQGWIGEARLAALLPALLMRQGKNTPTLVAAYAFDLVTPAQRKAFAACEAAGITVAHVAPPEHQCVPKVVRTASPREELEWAARWARTRLENWDGTRMPRIAVVVPDLGEKRELVRRVFGRVLAPSGESGLFDLSLGRPLSAYPLVDAALTAIDLVTGEIAFDRASRLLRSPFIAGAETERGMRARLDLALRAVAPTQVTLSSLASLVAQVTADERGHRKAPGCPLLGQAIEASRAVAKPAKSAEPSEWAGFFARILAAIGFPGERSRNSAEHQTLAKWNEALAGLGALGAVTGRITGEAARRHLRQACAETLFQPETGEAPVQVLGLLESVGLDFDALWVCGLTDDAWPRSPRPHPFLPVRAQRQAGIPQASAESSLESDRRITQGWSRAAPEVVFSHATADADRELAPSPLIAGYGVVPMAYLDIERAPTRIDALFTAGRDPGAFTTFSDEAGPPLADLLPLGGTRILADQAACPFRAFARHRLGAEGVEPVEPGLGPAERGILLHALFANVWDALVDHAGLVGKTPEVLQQIVDESARRAVRRLKAEQPGRLEGRFESLEIDRLSRIALEWLVAEKSREPFAVAKLEERMTLHAGPLTLHGRVDRVDRLASGALAVIDYKSGRPKVSAWLGDRPDDPQLPLYALSMPEPVGAVAFAALKAGERRFEGLAQQSGGLPKVGVVSSHRSASKHHASWEELLKAWRAAIDSLATAFARGDARVDPKRQGATCRHCDVASVCRVRERVALEDEDLRDEDVDASEGEEAEAGPV